MTLYRFEGYEPALPEGDDFWIAPDANIIGKVIVETACSIWFGATLRGDNEPITVGAGSNIQENCVLHTDIGYPLTIGKNCTIGHKAILHGCTLGGQTLIGMGATILNGAKIGNNCLIGAGALVPEGREIPDGSLVMGMPCKVIRELDDAAIKGLLDSAKGYQEKMRRFRDTMKQASL